MTHEIKHINWIKTVLAELPDANSTTIQILVKAWSIYETRETNGLSHFLEHLFFKWGKKYPSPKSVAETIDAFGGDFNAFTGGEYAGYYIKCAPEFVPQAMDVLSDMMIHPQFPKEELEREKWVILQEIKMYEDNPQSRVRTKWNERYYGDNSYGWSTLGPAENVMSFTQDDLFKHKQNLYTKDNLVFIVAWAISDQLAIENMIGTLFWELPEKKQFETPKFILHTPESHEEKFVKDTQQNHLIISAPWFTMHDDQRQAAKILARILWWGMSSRLFQNIREKQWLCYYIRWAHDDSDSDGNFLIKAGMEKERREQWLQAIYDEIAKIATWDITQDEFDKSLGNITWRTKMGIETSDQLADFVWYQVLFKNQIRSLESLLADFQKLSLDDITAVAHKLERENLWAYWME